MTSVEWITSRQPVPYGEAVEAMERRAVAIRKGSAGEQVWLLEHPALYTAGTSARPEDLLDPDILPVYPSGRGGQFTYHGPGQRIAYVMLDLDTRGRDLRAFVNRLEDWLIAVLAEFGIAGIRREGRIGVWVARDDGTETKIAALGLRVRRWVTLHGVSLNIAPDLAHYKGIVPCGIAGYGVTSLADLGVRTTMADVDGALKRHFNRIFEAS